MAKRISLIFTIVVLFLAKPSYSSSPPPIPKIPIPDDITPNKGEGEENESQNYLELPPQVKLRISPPRNEEEAFKRIRDYMPCPIKSFLSNRPATDNRFVMSPIPNSLPETYWLSQP